MRSEEWLSDLPARCYEFRQLNAIDDTARWMMLCIGIARSEPWTRLDDGIITHPVSGERNLRESAGIAWVGSNSFVLGLRWYLFCVFE